MPIPSPVKSNDKLPNAVDIAVIGGGIAGVATALELVEDGKSVAIFEKGIIAGEQSSRNWGWCRQMGRDPRELPLIQVSLELWRQMHQRLGEDVGFRECGISYLCANDRQMGRREAWFNSYAGTHGLNTRMMTAEEANELTPGSTVLWKGGLYTPDDGRAEPTLAVPAMARAAQKKGALIFQNTAVRGIERTAGQVSSVVTEHGVVRCGAAVLAGGVWSRRFCHNLGIELPQLSVINSVLRTSPLETGIDRSFAGEKFAVRKRFDGGYTIAHSIKNYADIIPDSFRLFGYYWPILKEEFTDYSFGIGKRFLVEARLPRRWSNDEVSPFEKIRVLDPKPNQNLQDDALRSLHKTLPVFKNVKIVERWAGVIDVLPDVVPILMFQVSLWRPVFPVTGLV